MFKKLLLASLLSASCTTIIVQSNSTLLEYNSDCSYSVSVETADGTGHASCTAYKTEKMQDGTYKIYFITAAHITQASKSQFQGIHIIFNNKSRYEAYALQEDVTRLPAKVEYVNTQFDIATISTITTNIIPVAKISTRLLKEHESVYTLSFPAAGKGLMYTDGDTCYFNTVDKLWTCNAPISHGSSGGGVYDSVTGELIGIVSEVGAVQSGFSMIFVWHIHSFSPLSNLAEVLK